MEDKKSESSDIFTDSDDHDSDSDHNLLTPPQSVSPDLWPNHQMFTPPPPSQQPPPPPIQASSGNYFDYNDYQPRLSTPSGSSDSPKYDRNRDSPKESKLGIGYRNIQQSVQQERMERPFNPTIGSSRTPYYHQNHHERGYYRYILFFLKKIISSYRNGYESYYAPPPPSMHTRPVSVVYPSSRVEPPPGFQNPDLRRRHNVQPITESWDMFTPDEQRRQREEEVNKKVSHLRKWFT